MAPAATYRVPGIGLTRLALDGDVLVAGQPRNGYRERRIPLAEIAGFCVENNDVGGRGFDNFVLVFSDAGKRRVYRLAVDAANDAFEAVVASLAARCPSADLTALPVREALARMGARSLNREVAIIFAVTAGGLALIALAMLILWYRSR
jgi:hypothetical protein